MDERRTRRRVRVRRRKAPAAPQDAARTEGREPARLVRMAPAGPRIAEPAVVQIGNAGPGRPRVTCTHCHARVRRLRTHVCPFVASDHYKCPRAGCSFARNTKNKLQVHLRAHRDNDRRARITAEFPPETAQQKMVDAGLLFLCPVDGCRATAKKMNNLQKHIKNMHSLRPFVCEFAGCAASFHSAAQYEEHANSKHTRTTILECMLCPYRTASSRQFDRHVAGH